MAYRLDEVLRKHLTVKKIKFEPKPKAISDMEREYWRMFNLNAVHQEMRLIKILQEREAS